MKRLPLFACFILFVLLCASSAFWALRFFKPKARAFTAPPAAVQPELNMDAAAGLFGGRSVNLVSSNYQLKGVVDARNNAGSVALLSADGKPAQAYAVGVEIVPGVSVKEVHSKYIMLSEGGILKRVDLPEVDPNAKSDGVINPLPIAAAPQMPPPAAMVAAPPVIVPPAPPPADAANVQSQQQPVQQQPGQPQSGQPHSPGQGRAMRMGR